MPISCPASAIGRSTSRSAACAASWPTMNQVIVRSRSREERRAPAARRVAGTTGSASQPASPCVFRYDHWLSRSSDRLASGLRHDAITARRRESGAGGTLARRAASVSFTFSVPLTMCAEFTRYTPGTRRRHRRQPVASSSASRPRTRAAPARRGTPARRRGVKCGYIRSSAATNRSRISSSDQLEERIVRGDVLRQVDEVLAAELGRIDERRHLDHGGERHPVVGDVRDVVVRERLLQQQRRADDALVADAVQPLAFVGVDRPGTSRAASGAAAVTTTRSKRQSFAVGQLDARRRRRRDSIARDRGAVRDLDAAARSACSPKPLEDAGVAAADVAEHLLLQPGPPRGVHARDDRPDERGRGDACSSRRASPAAAAARSSRTSAGPTTSRSQSATGIRSSRFQSLIREAQKIVSPSRSLSSSPSGGKLQELERVRHRVQPAVGVEAGLRLDPAQLVCRGRARSSSAADVRVGQQDDVVVPVPGDVAELPGVGQPAEVRGGFEQRDARARAAAAGGRAPGRACRRRRCPSARTWCRSRRVADVRFDRAGGSSGRAGGNVAVDASTLAPASTQSYRAGRSTRSRDRCARTAATSRSNRASSSWPQRQTTPTGRAGLPEHQVEVGHRSSSRPSPCRPSRSGRSSGRCRSCSRPRSSPPRAPASAACARPGRDGRSVFRSGVVARGKRSLVKIVPARDHHAVLDRHARCRCRRSVDLARGGRSARRRRCTSSRRRCTRRRAVVSRRMWTLSQTAVPSPSDDARLDDRRRVDAGRHEGRSARWHVRHEVQSGQQRAVSVCRRPASVS